MEEAGGRQGREAVAEGERGTGGQGADAGVAVGQVVGLSGVVQQRRWGGEQLLAQGIEGEVDAG
ncbi:hypothetical protein B1218_37895, partial [Pseudomonas ogarae]